MSSDHLQLPAETIALIQNIADSHDWFGTVIGLRALHDDQLVNVGEIADESAVWISDERTAEGLGGTAAFILWQDGDDPEDLTPESTGPVWRHAEHLVALQTATPQEAQP